MGNAWNTRAAGGSDSYGYVSQAHAWLRGGPPIPEPLVGQIGVRDADRVASPLGYRPGRHAGEIVPIYPPGLPLLMAFAMLVAGPGGAFLVSPILGAVATWCTFLLGRRFATPSAGAVASALLATNPTFLYQVVQPMSDVPVTALWTASVVLACRRRPRSWALAGLAAGAAILVRPNLAPLAAVVALAGASAGAWDAGETRRSIAGRLSVFALPVAAAVVCVLSVNVAWYGSASSTGYGTADQLYSTAHILPNLRFYGTALLETNPVALPLALVAGVVLAVRGAWPGPCWRAAALAGWFAAVVALYLPYLSFPEWWYTRFLLPGMPALMVLVAMVLARAASEWRVPAGVTAAVAIAALVAGVWIARERSVFGLRSAEAKYADTGRIVRTVLPARALVFAMQHSGSVRFYGERPTLRWDLLRPGDMDGLLARMRAQGRPCYAVLDPGEHDPFYARFAGTRAVREAKVGRLYMTKHGVEILKFTE
jgi:4-amino-4-deoxy-L-arabinose transferase-like glycosyltransferase